MGIVQVPDYTFLWSSNKYLGNAGVKEIMPVRRYEKINQYLHANGSGRANPQDKLLRSDLFLILFPIDAWQSTNLRRTKV